MAGIVPTCGLNVHGGVRPAVLAQNRPSRHKQTGKDCRVRPIAAQNWPSVRWPNYCSNGCMQPSTEPTQASPVQVRTTRNGPAAPSRGAPDRFGDALSHALVSTAAAPGVAKDTTPPIGLPALAAGPAEPNGAPIAQPDQPAKDTPAPLPAEAIPGKPSADGAKPSDGRLPLFQPQLSSPTPPAAMSPEAAPSQAAPQQTAAASAQPAVLSSDNGCGPSAAAGKTPPQVAPVQEPGITGTPAGPAAKSDRSLKDAPAAPSGKAKPDKPSVDASKSSEDSQPPSPLQLLLPVLPQAVPPLAVPLQAAVTSAQPASAPSNAGDGPSPAAPDDAGATVAGLNSCQPPSIPALAAAQTAAQSGPAAKAPSRAAMFSGADPAIHAAPGHALAVTAKGEPTADIPAFPVEAAPLPAVPTAPSGAVPAASTPTLRFEPAPAAGEPEPASPAGQVGPVLASFAVSAAHPGAPQNMVIRLDPAELGRVQVRIERPAEGPARVELVVERADTLLLLLRDQPQLQRALDLAGVPSADRTLQFHLAPPDAGSGQLAAQANADHGQGQHRPGQPQSNRSGFAGRVSNLSEPISGPAAFRRAGVDITA